jgi:hypothetical protein
MKLSRNIHAFIAVGLLSAVLFACEKEMKLSLPVETDLSGKALIKVYNATLNAARNYVYVDKVPVTGAALVYGGLFPSVSYYSAINAGSRTVDIKDTLITSTQKALTFTSTFDAGSHYTIFTYDTVTNTKHLVVKDNIQVPTDTTARLRFANLIYSRVAAPNVDIYSAKRKENIFTNVATAAVTDFIPYATDISDTLFVRATGTVINLTQLNSVLPREKRSYTVVFRGVYQLTTGINTRALVNFTNY